MKCPLRLRDISILGRGPECDAQGSKGIYAETEERPRQAMLVFHIQPLIVKFRLFLFQRKQLLEVFVTWQVLTCLLQEQRSVHPNTYISKQPPLPHTHTVHSYTAVCNHRIFQQKNKTTCCFSPTQWYHIHIFHYSTMMCDSLALLLIQYPVCPNNAVIYTYFPIIKLLHDIFNKMHITHPFVGKENKLTKKQIIGNVITGLE